MSLLLASCSGNEKTASTNIIEARIQEFHGASSENPDDFRLLPWSKGQTELEIYSGRALREDKILPNAKGSISNDGDLKIVLPLEVAAEDLHDFNYVHGWMGSSNHDGIIIPQCDAEVSVQNPNTKMTMVGFSIGANNNNRWLDKMSKPTITRTGNVKHILLTRAYYAYVNDHVRVLGDQTCNYIDNSGKFEQSFDLSLKKGWNQITITYDIKQNTTIREESAKYTFRSSAKDLNWYLMFE